jgi:hypothetical protein
MSIQYCPSTYQKKIIDHPIIFNLQFFSPMYCTTPSISQCAPTLPWVGGVLLEHHTGSHLGHREASFEGRLTLFSRTACISFRGERVLQHC